jgi:hypothetical protein
VQFAVTRATFVDDDAVIFPDAAFAHVAARFAAGPGARLVDDVCGYAYRGAHATVRIIEITPPAFAAQRAAFAAASAGVDASARVAA